MNPTVEYVTDSIVIKSRGLLEVLTLGNWGTLCRIDLLQKTIELRIFRVGHVMSTTHHWREFDAVDYSMVVLSSTTWQGVESDFEEFRVGLRFCTDQSIFPLARFRGTVKTLTGFNALLDELLPASWNRSSITHEVAARSLANMLCQKMCLNLAL